MGHQNEGRAFPTRPKITGSEPTPVIQKRVTSYCSEMRRYWQAHGIDFVSTAGPCQISRLLEILRVCGNRGLGSIEGRTAGALLQLPARIFDLKLRGFGIVAVRESAWGLDGLWHRGTVRYFLVSEPEANFQPDLIAA